MPLVHLDNDFEPKRSSKDVQEIITVLVRAGIRECQSYSSLCHSWMRQVDVFGRTTLHLAASFGKLDMLEWILEEKKVDLNQKDFESAWTALHRSLFYGQLNCARLLTQVKSLGPIYNTCSDSILNFKIWTILILYAFLIIVIGFLVTSSMIKLIKYIIQYPASFNFCC